MQAQPKLPDVMAEDAKSITPTAQPLVRLGRPRLGWDNQATDATLTGMAMG
jgi:hypothetical protein